MPRPLIAVALSAMIAAPALLACSGPPPGASGEHADAPAAQPETTKDAAAMTTPPADDLNGFIPNGMTLVDSVRGDLTGNGGHDALLVVAPPTPAGTALGEGMPRSMLLLVDSGNGGLQLAARNDRLVPCQRCGGLAGDPYAFSRIDAGGFTVSLSGGSRERWATDYHFAYRAADQRWLLHQVTRVVTDTETGQRRDQQLDAGALGSPDFSQFDPATLPVAPQLEVAEQ